MAKHLHVNSNFYYLLQWPSNPASFVFCLHFFSIVQEEWTFQKEYRADPFLTSLPLQNSEPLTSVCIPLVCQAVPSSGEYLCCPPGQAVLKRAAPILCKLQVPSLVYFLLCTLFPPRETACAARCEFALSYH